MPIFYALIIAVAFPFSGCVREQPAPAAKEQPAAKQATPERVPLVGSDLTGRPRAAPRATMGALEAEPGSAPPASRPEGDKRLKEDRTGR
ncbi:hypothetical protein SVA_1363 [Sulfurifustis variabilis]|uniref:Uncharacterized protein n=1 Tax=Sulfurifustis variabilis TaxID=1675686 RepID=A0A1B4V2Z2_9GAMM|nr:hypothetical protein SVA_1363 [Sulfurifustis variabilis]